MKKRFSAILLAVFALFTLSPTAAFASEPFSDTYEHWAVAAIETWVERGVLFGSNGKFRPNAPITRAELAVMLTRIVGYTATSKNTFTDVPRDAWYAADIAKLHAAGIMLGNGAGIMRPTANVTREEATVLIARAFAVNENAEYAYAFPDASKISAWAVPLVGGMKAAGYVNGDMNGNFNPKADITRAEIVTILNNMLSLYFSEADTYDCGTVGERFSNALVNTSGVILKNLTLSGSLYVTEGVGDGDVTLENVVVRNTLFIRGGGAHSIHIVGGEYSAIVLDSATNTHNNISPDTVIGRVQLNNSGSITMGDATLTYSAETGTTSVGGTIDGVVLNADSSSTVTLGGISIDIAPQTDAPPTLALEVGAVVKEIVTNGAATVVGEGKIDKMTVNSDGVIVDKSVDVKPENITVGGGATITVGGTEYSGNGDALPASDATSSVNDGGTSDGGNLGGGTSSGGNPNDFGGSRPQPQPSPEPAPSPEPKPEDLRPKLDAIANPSVLTGVLTWDAHAEATGYIVKILKSDGTAAQTHETDTSVRSLDVYALDLPLGDYVIALQARGNDEFADSVAMQLDYSEKMIRDVSVRANFNNFKSQDASQHWIYHIVDFGIKSDMTFEQFNNGNLEPFVDIYSAFLLGNDAEKAEAAAAIGNDLMLTFYYYGDSGEKVVLSTTGGEPFSKNKLWDGWLWSLVDDTFTRIEGDDPNTSIGRTAPRNTTLRTVSNIGNAAKVGNTSMRSLDLSKLYGNTLYIAIDLIHRDADGKLSFYQETAELEIPDPRPKLDAVTNPSVLTGVLTWGAHTEATGYIVKILKSDGTAAKTHETDTSVRSLDLYALDLPLGNYVIALQARGNDAFADSVATQLDYSEKMIRDVSVRANFNNFNKDESQQWIQHFVNFSIKSDMTFEQFNGGDLEPFIDIYSAFLLGNDAEKAEAAAAIGNDLMLTFYYLNDGGEKVVLSTTGGEPFSRNKLWDGWLWQMTGGENVRIVGSDPNTSIGCTVQGGAALQTSSNIGNVGSTVSVRSHDLSAIRGRTLYVDIDLIYRDTNGELSFYRETASLDI